MVYFDQLFIVLPFFFRPFSYLYGFVTDVRNYTYDSNWQKSHKPQQKTISVGNLTVGGTGKTPMIEYLLRVLSQNQPKHTMATLSRGYGRETKGYRLANPADTASTIGDEPLQIYRKFGHQVWVTVGERRAEALKKLNEQHPEVNLVLLDDAFQHRAVSPHLSILLMDYNRPFYEDHPFPAGRLRERRHGARRADMVIVTKCPDRLSNSDQARIKMAISQYTRANQSIPIFFTGLTYLQPHTFSGQVVVNMPRKVVLVTGIAQAGPLESYVRQTFAMSKHHRFGDHHVYTRSDVDRILDSLPSDTALLTTEKDWVKLSALFSADEQSRLPLFYLPIGCPVFWPMRAIS